MAGGGYYNFVHKKPLSFNEYLKEQGNGGSWEQTAGAQTLAPGSLKELEQLDHLKQLFIFSKEQARREAGDENISEQNKKAKSAFREQLLDIAESLEFHSQSPWIQTIQAFKRFANTLVKLEIFLEPSYYKTLVTSANAFLDGDEDNLEIFKLEDIRTQFQSENSGEVNQELSELLADFRLLTKCSGEYRRTLRDFISDPEFITQPGNLRKTILALVHALGNRQLAQYHLALIFDNSLISQNKSWSNEAWRFIDDTLDEKQQSAGLLGAIVILNDRSLVQKITALSEKSKEMTHPVFDTSGVLRWPKAT